MVGLIRDVPTAAEAEAGVGKEGLPPFHGVPISIKDLNDTAGIRTTWGTRAWADLVPTVAELVERIMGEAEAIVRDRLPAIARG